MLALANPQIVSQGRQYECTIIQGNVICSKFFL